MIMRGVRGLSFQQLVHTNRHWIANFYTANSLHHPNEELDKLKNTSKLLVEGNEKEPSSTTTERYCYEFCQGYSKLPSGEVRDFLLHLAPSCQINKQLVLEAASTILKQNSDAKFDKLQKSLQSVLNPPIIKIFSKIGQTRGGIKFLVDLRKDVLTQMKTLDPTSQDHKDLQELSQCLKNLLSVWISVGFMNIRRVTWDSASSLLEKISVYEAVHPLRGWTDLKSRLGPYRRVFVYTHPSMSEEPLVVLHVALTKEISGCMSSVLKEFRSVKGFNREMEPSSFHQSEQNIDEVDTAIFYSITSTQLGLQGIELGNHLIKQAVSELRRELPGLSRFSTLSPIPGFKSWLLLELMRYRRGDTTTPLTIHDKEILENFDGTKPAEDTLSELVKSGSWVGDEKLENGLNKVLLKLCARYLYQEKRRSKALNPVANFHVRNGATLYRINWLADPSPRGISQSCGIMVNYRYYLPELEDNANKYLTEHTIPVDKQVLQLLDMQY